MLGSRRLIAAIALIGVAAAWANRAEAQDGGAISEHSPRCFGVRVEWIEADRAAVRDLAKSGDAGAMHAALREAVAKGEARLFDLSYLIVQESGRARLASVTQWRSATEAHLFYDPPEPTGFAEKHTGSWGDFQATPAPDGRFDLRGDFEWSARLGDSPSAEKPFRQPAIFSAREARRWPEFAGGWALIGVYDPPPLGNAAAGAPPDRCLAALMHAGAIGYPEAFPARQESELDPFAPDPDPPAAPVVARLVIEQIAVPAAEAIALLDRRTGWNADAAPLCQDLDALIEAGSAQRLDTQIVRSLNGWRAENSSEATRYYQGEAPTEEIFFDLPPEENGDQPPPEPKGRPPILPRPYITGALDEHKLGARVDAELVGDAERGTVSLSLVARITRLLGEESFGSVPQPVVHGQSVAISAEVAAGRPMLGAVIAEAPREARPGVNSPKRFVFFILRPALQPILPDAP